MAEGAVQIGRRVYAAGLFWQVSPSPQIASAAKTAALQVAQASDVFALRAGTKTGRLGQFGLGQTAMGHKLGLPSLAASLANKIPGSWAGAFRIRETTIIIVVRDDLITPDGDQVFLDETEARTRLLQEINLGGLERVYAPESWGVPEAENTSLVLLLQDQASSYLQPVKVPKEAVLLLVAVLGLGLVGFGIYSVVDYFQEQARKETEAAAEAQRRAQEALNARKTQQAISGVVDYPKLWEKEPKPFEVLDACRVVLPSLSTEYQGWTFSGATCDKSGYNVAWTRGGKDGATVATLIPEASISGDLNSASRHVALPDLKPRGPEVLLCAGEVQAFAMTQGWDATFGALPDDPPPPPPPGVPPEDYHPPPPPFSKLSVAMTMKDLPGQLDDYFSDIPGFIINSLTYQGENWSVAGTLYEDKTSVSTNNCNKKTILWSKP